MNSVSSRTSSRVKGSASRKGRRSNKDYSKQYSSNHDWCHDYEEQCLQKEMHLPYWERKEYKSYKQIKVL